MEENKKIENTEITKDKEKVTNDKVQDKKTTTKEAPNNNIEFFKRKNEDSKKSFTPNDNRDKNNKGHNSKRPPRRKIPSEFEERIISIRRVVKVTKGGRKFRFSALVVIGDKKGRVGFGFGKSNEVPDAIKKAIKNAKKSLITVKIIGEQETVSHEWVGHHGASKVVIKPAKEGTGIIASESVRSILELAGVRNVYTKSLGSNTPQNTIRATIDALEKMKTKEEFQKLRGIKNI